MFRVGTALVAAGAALSFVPSASAVADLSTADKALYCGISEGEPPIKLICWCAKDGYTVSMTRLSRPTGRLYRPNRGNRDPVVGRKLQFGQPWSIAKSWTCISYRDGITCVNRTGHGWSLGSRAGAKLF
jgi:hypothetical protein